MMIRAALFSAAAALLTAAPAPAQDSRPVVLKPHPSSADAVVTLGDIFENAGDAADVMLARAPEPGRQLSLDPGLLRQTAARHGLAWSNAGEVARVTVEREGRLVPAAEIEALIAQTFYAREGEVFEVALAGRAPALFAPVGAVDPLELIDLRRDEATRMFRAELRAYAGGPVAVVGGRAEAVIEAPVLVRPVARGEVVREADITWTRLAAGRLPADLLSSEDALVGMEARRALRPGEALRAFDFKAPDMVMRGQTVRVVYRSGPLTLTTRARALDSAPEGAVARFMTLQSNRTIEAVVTGPGEARLGPGAARDA